MKILKLLKSTPFLITIFLILFLCINNRKENTDIRILIWDTPSLPLGTYLAISAGTGYIFSYILTTNISKIQQTKFEKKLSYKYSDAENNAEDNAEKEMNKDYSYDNTLIERDINQPSPTINASFRVIGKNKRNKQSLHHNQSNDYNSSDYSNEPEIKYNQREISVKNDINIESQLIDWDDDSYNNW